MHMHHRHPRRHVPLALITGLSILLMFILAACGSASGTGGTGSAPSSTPTAGGSTTAATGCPNNATDPGAPAANVLIKPSQANSTITVHVGDVIEVRLPFGHKWSGPTASQGQLELQAPSGYASNANSVCVWRFVAKGTGTTQLSFTSQALCKPGELCPQYIMSVPFTIDVK